MANLGAMERNEFISRIEGVIRQSTQFLHRLAIADQAEDKELFLATVQKWSEANHLWLQVARGMSPEKAHAVMIGSAMGGKLRSWFDERISGPPPSVLDMYDGPISDEEFGKSRNQ